MRLSAEQIKIIMATSRTVAGDRVRVWLYGSRLDDGRHGGDIDLLLEPDHALTVMQRARIKALLEQKLNLPVDVLLHNPGTQGGAFVSMARAKAQLLGGVQ